ncbi:MAG: hypothetical protein P4L43_03390 [Syntrophobacteraceae bacterium]|nr:hypothetical protein [Syntrophobacteraceae bacterium]
MHSIRLSLLALTLILAMTIVAPLLLAAGARANCPASVSKYGQCTYKGDLLFCGACALSDSQSSLRGCDRCGAGYLCKSNSCAVLNRCAYNYSCDLCGCSWGRKSGLARPETHRVQ